MVFSPLASTSVRSSDARSQLLEILEQGLDLFPEWVALFEAELARLALQAAEVVATVCEIPEHVLALGLLLELALPCSLAARFPILQPLRRARPSSWPLCSPAASECQPEPRPSALVARWPPKG